MARNKTIDLNNHLFEQLERLNDEELNAEQLENEIKRTESMVKISGAIIANNKLQLDAAKVLLEYGSNEGNKVIPESLLITHDKKN